MVLKVQNVDKMYYEDFFCVVYSYNKTSADFELLPHGNSTKTGHPYIRTSQAILDEEDQMLTTTKPHKVYDEMVKSANPLTSSSQSEEPRNLKQVQNRQYILQKKLKDVSKLFFLYELHIELNSKFYRDLRDSSGGSAFTLHLAWICLISIMIANFKATILQFDCGLVKIYHSY